MILLLFFSVLFSFFSSDPKSVKDLRWEKRVLILFEPIDLDSSFWEENEDEFKERKIAMFYVSQERVLESNYSDEITLESLKAMRGNRDTDWVLIGLDGGVKETGSAENFDLSRLWRKIDSMPMRQSEIRKKDGY